MKIKSSIGKWNSQVIAYADDRPTKRLRRGLLLAFGREVQARLVRVILVGIIVSSIRIVLSDIAQTTM